MSVEQRLQHIEDRLNIKELKYRYCRAVDQREWETWVDQFAPDGTFEIEDAGEFHGQDELTRLATETLVEEYTHSLHVALNPTLDISGDTADGEWNLLLFYVQSDGTIGTRYGHYVDTYVRTADGWKIQSERLSFIAHESVSLSGAKGLGEY